MNDFELPTESLRGSALLGGWTRLLPLTFAISGTVAFLFAVRSLMDPDTRFYTLILERGWTQPITLALFAWGLGHSLRRLLIQIGERQALRSCRELIKEEEINAERVPRLIGALFPLRESLSGPLLVAILSYFRNQRPTRDEVLKVAHQEMSRSEDRIEHDYRGLAACMWLLPLSGFLGTVVGMAAAIGSFDQVIGSLGSDLSALAPSVMGLATAFDTTLLALVLVVPLKIMEVGLEGRDRRLLDAMDAHLGTGLVRALDLAGLAQQTPAEAALDRFGESVARVENNLRRIDGVLGDIAQRVEALPSAGLLLEELLEAAQMTRVVLPEMKQGLLEAAQVTRAILPEMKRELRDIRQNGDRPLIISRGPQP